VLFDSGMSGFFGDVFGFSGGNFTITFFGIWFALERLVFLLCLTVYSWHLSLCNQLLIVDFNICYYIKYRKYFIFLSNLIQFINYINLILMRLWNSKWFKIDLKKCWS
jgi:hypothetical protein